MNYFDNPIGYCAAGLATVLLLTGCDVTNPGPVQDEFLAQPASQQGLVNGAIRDISDAMGDNTYETAALAREIFPEDTKLMINDYGILNDMNAAGRYREIIELLQLRGLIDGIGVQGHAFNTRPGQFKGKEVLDFLAENQTIKK